MKILGESSREEVILTWLRSEWHGLAADMSLDTDVIDNADLKDAKQNVVRARLLAHRDVILNGIPGDAPAKHVLIEKEDLPKLYIIPTPEWYPDTGGTFRLTATTANLKPGRGMRIPGYGNGPIDVYDAIREKTEYMHDNGTASDEVIILISSSLDGPYTIIDGNHRAVALYRAQAAMPWQGILIYDPRIARSRWFINSPQAQRSIQQMNIYASHGLLW